MPLTIASWNMQGNGQERLRAIANMDAGNCLPDVILLQESGNPERNGISSGRIVTVFMHNYRCYCSDIDPTAKFYRCTNSILVRQDRVPYVSAVEIIDQVGYRPCPFVVFGNIVIANIHAHADNTAQAVVVNALHFLMDHYRMWILMGDMNSNVLEERRLTPPFTPGVPVRVNLATRSRPDICRCIYPQNPTQGSDGVRRVILDYLYISEDLYLAMQSPAMVPIDSFYIRDSAGHWISDHNMVITSLPV